jgi:hypothetical protein
MADNSDRGPGSASKHPALLFGVLSRRCLSNAPTRPKTIRGSYYQALYQRLCSRCGPQKAICAVASILTAVYHMLKNKNCLPGHRRRPLQSPVKDYTDHAPGKTLGTPWLCSRNPAARRLSGQVGALGLAEFDPIAMFIRAPCSLEARTNN